jgi:hypothetical protein
MGNVITIHAAPPTEIARRSSAGVREDLMRTNRDGVREFAELLESVSISLSQAAYRGSDVAIGVHARQAWDVIVELRKAVKQLERLAADIPPDPEGRAS